MLDSDTFHQIDLSLSTIANSNPEKKLMGQIKKSSKLRKDQKALISVSAENLTAMAIDSYLEGRLGTRLYLQTNLGIFKLFGNS